MLLFQTLTGSAELALGMLAQTRLGAVGVVLLVLIGIYIRAQRIWPAFWAAVIFTLLMVQA
jgi:hypothetical protein